MGPGWCEVLRFAAGSRLRAWCVLKPAAREALQRASPRAADWVQGIEGAEVIVEALDPNRCRLRWDAGPRTALLEGERREDGCHRLRVELAGAPAGAFESDAVALMLGGPREAYIAERGGRGTRLLARLAYDERDGALAVSFMTAAFASRMPPGMRAIAPAELPLLRLLPLAPGP